MKKIGKYTLRQIYWFLEAGRPRRKTGELELVLEKQADIPPPVFFLSTGRTGTKWFATLLEQEKKFIVFHQAVPLLALQNKFMYELQHNAAVDRELVMRTGSEIFWAARVEYFMQSYKTGKAFLETNNELVFFAEVIARLFPRSKFVHLYRHPGDFVRSAIIRGWYENERSKKKLIIPHGVSGWNELSLIEKNAYLWLEVNTFIDQVKKNVGEDRFFTLNFSRLELDRVKDLVEFTGATIPASKIKKLMGKKINKAKANTFPVYEAWPEEDKEKLRRICGRLAAEYGFKL